MADQASGTILKEFIRKVGWSREELLEELKFPGGGNVASINDWFDHDARPNKKNSERLERAICSAVGDKEGAIWWEKLRSAWQVKTKSWKKKLLEAITTDPKLNTLPPLFETDMPLPLAAAYVELRLSPSTRLEAKPDRLEQPLTLSERLNRRNDARYALRRSPREALDSRGLKSALILGPPGAGKSSLLRRVALDIAGANAEKSNKWKVSDIPLFVEARAWWSRAKDKEECRLIAYSLAQLIPESSGLSEVIESLENRPDKRTKPPIVLVDGLDEIASIPTAVDRLSDELSRLTALGIPWIATARPAGLVHSLYEQHRFELLSLDEEASETLIDNWCSTVNEQTETVNAEHLKAEIFGSPTMRDMGSNPFLLTALCFLKSTLPSADLPTSRIAVYETLLREIARQAQLKLPSGRAILSPPTIEALEQFSRHLYEREDAPIQIFSDSHWSRFVKTDPKFLEIDFHAQVLPARLITAWNELGGDFHFVHLSLQEHMIARALLDEDVEYVLERRFIPAWRSVFRFYGSLLLHSGRRSDFRTLVNRLYEEEDYNRFSLLTLTEIFADAGIKNTTEWIEEDLRENLYMASIAGAAAGPEAMIDALAALDPEWLEEKSVFELEDDFAQIFDHIDKSGESFPGASFANFGRLVSNSPYEKLARARTGSSRVLVRETFFGEDHAAALISAEAFASFATPSERNRVVQLSEDCEMFDESAARVIAFSRATLRAELLPFLSRVAQHTQPKEGCALFDEALRQIAEIGGADALQVLHQCLLFEIGRLGSGYSAFEFVSRAMVRYGGDDAANILRKVAREHPQAAVEAVLENIALQAAPHDEARLLQLLEDDKTDLSELVDALAGAATYERFASPRVIDCIKCKIDIESQTIKSMATDLALLEGARLEAGLEPVLTDLLYEIAVQHYELISAPDGSDAVDYLTSNVALIFDTLGKNPNAFYAPLAQMIMFDQPLHSDLALVAIGLLGRIYEENADQALLELFVDKLFSDRDLDSDIAHALALAIGRMDLEALFRLRGAVGAKVVLEELAADKDILIFEDFFASRDGSITRWENPGTPVLYIAETDEFNAPSLMSHVLASYGFYMEEFDVDLAAAAIVFEPLSSSFTRDLLEQAQRRSRGPDKTPLFIIPESATEEEVRDEAHRIGSQISALAKSKVST